MKTRPAPVYPADYLAAAAIPYGRPNPTTGRPYRPGTRSLTADSPAAPAATRGRDREVLEHA